MLIFPAIDLFEGKAVRLLKGDYSQMTVYSEHPEDIAAVFSACGAHWLHMVDLEGARSGETPNLSTIKNIKSSCSLSIQLGGGIRNMAVVEKYLSAGISRVILGTAAVTSPGFVEEAVKNFGKSIAVGVDMLNGKVAIRGWTENSQLDGFEFCRRMQDLGVETVISTDISKDGAMQGANHELYEKLSSQLNINIVASGGVSSLEDVKRLRALDLYAAIIGKAYYTGAISLREAIETAR